MPPYTPDLTKVSAGIPQLPKGDYEFSISEVKLFKRDRTEPDNTVTKLYGPQINLVVARSDDNPEFLGKTIPQSLYLNNEKTWGIAKRLVMAAYGYAINDEDAFNKKFKDADWTCNPETDTLGDIWTGMAGKRVAATADLVPQKGERAKEGALNQQFNWRPI